MSKKRKDKNFIDVKKVVNPQVETSYKVENILQLKEFSKYQDLVKTKFASKDYATKSVIKSYIKKELGREVK